MTKVFAALAVLTLSLTALPAFAECMGKNKPHDTSATTGTGQPVIKAPESSV